MQVILASDLVARWSTKTKFNLDGVVSDVSTLSYTCQSLCTGSTGRMFIINRFARRLRINIVVARKRVFLAENTARNKYAGLANQ